MAHAPRRTAIQVFFGGGMDRSGKILIAAAISPPAMGKFASLSLGLEQNGTIFVLTQRESGKFFSLKKRTGYFGLRERREFRLRAVYLVSMLPLNSLPPPDFNAMKRQKSDDEPNT